MYKYYMCLDEKNYNVLVGEDYSEILNNYETMLDNLINLLRGYGIEDEEIKDAIKDDTSIVIEEE